MNPHTPRLIHCIRVLRWRVEFRILSLAQLPFGFVFWLIEQRTARLRDRLANEGIEL